MVRLCGCAGWSAPFVICKQQSQGFLVGAHMMPKPRDLASTPGWPCQKPPDLIMQLFQRRTNKECLLTVPMQCFFCGSFLLFVFRDCLSYCLISRSVPWSLVVTFWERLTSWLSCMWCFLVFLSLSHMMSYVRCGIWLYRFLIFAFFIYLIERSHRCIDTHLFYTIKETLVPCTPLHSQVF